MNDMHACIYTYLLEYPLLYQKGTIPKEVLVLIFSSTIIELYAENFWKVFHPDIISDMEGFRLWKCMGRVNSGFDHLLEPHVLQSLI